MAATKRMAGWAAVAARGLLLDRQASFWRRALRDPRARVVDVIVETPDTRTFVLRPGAGWRGHRAGQHATLEVELDGVRLRRCYSISSAPGGPTVALTVKRLPGGRVSGWLHDRVRAGDAVGLGPAGGDFVLPAPLPDRLLFIAGGSGITPIMSMLRQLARDRALRDVVLVHQARRHEDVIFRHALDALAAAHPGLRAVRCLSQLRGERLDEARLAAAVPDFAARTTFLCGPPGLMAWVERLWAAAGAADRLRRERFVAPAFSSTGAAGPVEVRLLRAGRSVVIAGPSGSLLEALERAGVRPPSGCRMGVCHTCQCRKRAGTVRNLLTGAVSSEPDEDIQLCISAACSDVDLSL